MGNQACSVLTVLMTGRAAQRHVTQGREVSHEDLLQDVSNAVMHNSVSDTEAKMGC